MESSNDLYVFHQHSSRTTDLIEQRTYAVYKKKTDTTLRSRTVGTILSSSQIALKPYAYFAPIHEFVIELLQQRLSSMAAFKPTERFPSRLAQVQEEYYDEDIPYLLCPLETKFNMMTSVRP